MSTSSSEVAQTAGATLVQRLAVTPITILNADEAESMFETANGRATTWTTAYVSLPGILRDAERMIEDLCLPTSGVTATHVGCGPAAKGYSYSVKATEIVAKQVGRGVWRVVAVESRNRGGGSNSRLILQHKLLPLAEELLSEKQEQHKTLLRAVKSDVFAEQPDRTVIAVRRTNEARAVADAQRKAGARVRITTRVVAVQTDRPDPVIAQMIAATSMTDSVISSSWANTKFKDHTKSRNSDLRRRWLGGSKRLLVRASIDELQQVLSGENFIGRVKLVAAQSMHDNAHLVLLHPDAAQSDLDRLSVLLGLSIDGSVEWKGE